MSEHPRYYIELARKTIEWDKQKTCPIDEIPEDWDDIQKERRKHNIIAAVPLAERVLELEERIQEAYQLVENMKGRSIYYKLRAILEPKT